MNEIELQEWFDSLKNKLEKSYLRHSEPWKQSGFSGPEARWVACRKPVADCIETSGAFLDIGCANGYLLECIMKWIAHRNLRIAPYGLDLSEKLIRLARQRLPEYKDNFYVGNALFWNNPQQYEYVRTEIIYVPDFLAKQYIERIVHLFLKDDGRLLITEYRSREEAARKQWIDGMLKDWGFNIIKSLSGFYDNTELTRVFVIPK